MIQSKQLLNFSTLKHYFLEKNDNEFSILSDSIIANCIRLEQTHSNNVVIANKNIKYYKSTDGIVINFESYISIRTADCLPIFLYDSKKNVLAGIHAGWKGLYRNIIGNTVKVMRNLGCNALDIRSAIGPHIRSCCYKITDEFLELFRNYNNENIHLIKKNGTNKFFDLEKLASFQMTELGVLKKNIDIVPYCTSCDSRFCSYRKNGANCGRMLNIAGIV